MLDYIFDNLEKIATWRMFWILFIVCVVCNLGFWWRNNALGKTIVTFDGRKTGYTPEEAKQLLADLGPDGRRTYVLTQITLDLIFPFVYGGLFVILFSKLGLPRYFLLLPVLTVIADLLENFSAVFLTLNYQTDAPAPQFARLASIFTVTKWIGVLLMFLTLVGGFLFFLFRRFRA